MAPRRRKHDVTIIANATDWRHVGMDMEPNLNLTIVCTHSDYCLKVKIMVFSLTIWGNCTSCLFVFLLHGANDMMGYIMVTFPCADYMPDFPCKSSHQ